MKKAAVLSVLMVLAATIPLMAGGRNQAGTGTSAGSNEIEVFISPWNTVPLEGRDPYKEWLDSQTGMSWKLTRASDFQSELTTRAAANQMPDLIVFGSSQVLFSMYDQGILLDDWTPYRNVMPQAFTNMGDLAQRYYSRNGKVICVTTEGGDQFWCWNIRQDWLDRLGLKMPTTMDELLAVGRAFTFNDPDGNGRDDTYGFTSAGGNSGIGEIGNIGLMFGPTGFYVENNRVSHPIVDGNFKRTLDFIKSAVDQQIIDPDWYTIGWDERKPNVYNGKYGIVWYPPEALLAETDTMRLDGKVKDWYSVIPPIKATPAGGKLGALPPFGFIRTVSASTAQNKAKMDAITKILETCSLPNDEYYIIRCGYKIDNYEMITMEGGRKYFNWGTGGGVHRAGNQEGENYGLWNWGQMIASASLLGLTIQGTTVQPDDLIRKQIEMTNQVNSYERYPADSAMLNLNSDNQTQAGTVSSEFTIQYILGQTSDYDGFVRRWLASGGQALLDEATQQFRGYGIIR
jgi:putative aldouronate transport system substrate-binding protein